MATQIAPAPPQYTIGGRPLKLDSHIPDQLIEYDQWVVWQAKRKQGRFQKLPIDPRTRQLADVTDPSTWATYEQATALLNIGYEGRGFVVSESDPETGIDIDNCIDVDGRIHPKAWALVERLNSFTEITPSNLGLRIWTEANLPVGGVRGEGLEVYSSKRFFTVTGHHILDTPYTIENRQQEIDDLYWTHLKRSKLKPEQDEPQRHSDDHILSLVLRSAKHQRLWQGSYQGFDSQSESDLSLLGRIAFFSRNWTQTERIFSMCPLARRAKWQRVDYRNQSLKRAFTNLYESANPYVSWADLENNSELIDELACVTGYPFVILPTGKFKCLANGKYLDPTCAYMAHISGRPLGSFSNVKEPSFALWRVRMITDLGYAKRPFMELEPLPQNAPPSVVLVYEGFGKVLDCKYARSACIEPTTYSMHFIMDWCRVSYGTANRGLSYLLDNGIIETVGEDSKGNSLYLPSTLNSPFRNPLDTV